MVARPNEDKRQMIKFGEFCRELRDKKGYTLRYLAQVSGVSYGNLHHFERGESDSMKAFNAYIKFIFDSKFDIVYLWEKARNDN